MYQIDHPRILKLYDHFEEEDNIFLLLEFIQGGFDIYVRYSDG